MGFPTSEVGYTSATTRRKTTKSMMDMWWHWIKKNTYNINNVYSTPLISHNLPSGLTLLSKISCPFRR
jgi:hypothetical protein